MANWVNGKVVEKLWWTPSLFSIKVVADIDPFTAGQFTKLALPVEDKKVSRAYSFVNAPQDPLLEFFLIEVPDGQLSAPLAALDIGDDILVAGKPSGFFTLDEVPDASVLWMLSTGTAIGPFLSMLSDGKLWKRFDRVVLVNGVRHAQDLCYQDMLLDTEKIFKQFKYVPLVSREETAHTLSGRVTNLLESEELCRHCGFEQLPEDSQFMLCGNPQMVKDTTALLQTMGFARNRRAQPGHITVEQYW
ncbi:ferredoxin--NADP reductase [Pseudoalteromonas rubra]|uniref:ferredoxin--NADP(+) reductase n=1 Tax=Pseudoalteromonas rubra TaxID=43658 RepID=A0A0U3IRT3_9GAMM|nr:ferredoxin--NADP reductase [Pseudoalteromonas rubra]ALU46044.1 ferredoxin--NADP(+) reductase [Pseudoalteromonas rubra]